MKFRKVRKKFQKTFSNPIYQGCQKTWNLTIKDKNPKKTWNLRNFEKNLKFLTCSVVKFRFDIKNLSYR